MESMNTNTTDEYLSAAKIAQRWGVSPKMVQRILESHRGENGFIDLGRPERRFTRRYAIIRIAPSLLQTIEADMRSI